MNQKERMTVEVKEIQTHAKIIGYNELTSPHTIKKKKKQSTYRNQCIDYYYYSVV
jgi:hypothetical protein